jgi:hypothetical protein
MMWHSQFTYDFSQLVTFRLVMERARAQLGDVMRIRIDPASLDGRTLAELETAHRDLGRVTFLLSMEIERYLQHLDLQQPAEVVRGDSAVLGIHDPKQILARFHDLFYPTYYYVVKLVSYVDHGFDAEYYLRSYHDRNYAMTHERSWLIKAGRRVFDTLVRNRITQTLFMARRLTHAVLDRGVRQSLMSYAMLFGTIFYPLYTLLTKRVKIDYAEEKDATAHVGDQVVNEQMQQTQNTTPLNENIAAMNPESAQFVPTDEVEDEKKTFVMTTSGADFVCLFLENPLVWLQLFVLMYTAAMDALRGGDAGKLAAIDKQRKHSFANEWLNMATKLTTGAESSQAAGMLATHNPAAAAGLIAASMGTKLFDAHQESKYLLANNALQALDYAQTVLQKSPMMSHMVQLLVFVLLVGVSVTILQPGDAAKSFQCRSVFAKILDNWSGRFEAATGMTNGVFNWSNFGLKSLFAETRGATMQRMAAPKELYKSYKDLEEQKSNLSKSKFVTLISTNKTAQFVAIVMLVLMMAAMQEATVGEQLQINTIAPHHRWVTQPGSVVDDGPNPYNFVYPGHLLRVHKRATPYPDNEAYLLRCKRLHTGNLKRCQQNISELTMPTAEWAQRHKHRMRRSRMQQMLEDGAVNPAMAPVDEPQLPKIDLSRYIDNPQPSVAQRLTDTAQSFVDAAGQEAAPTKTASRRRPSTKRGKPSARPSSLEGMSRDQLAQLAVSRGLKQAGQTWKQCCGGYSKAALLHALSE